MTMIAFLNIRENYGKKQEKERQLTLRREERSQQRWRHGSTKTPGAWVWAGRDNDRRDDPSHRFVRSLASVSRCGEDLDGAKKGLGKFIFTFSQLFVCHSNFSGKLGGG